jgi:hypothetical protein
VRVGRTRVVRRPRWDLAGGREHFVRHGWTIRALARRPPGRGRRTLAGPGSLAPAGSRQGSVERPPTGHSVRLLAGCSPPPLAMSPSGSVAFSALSRSSSSAEGADSHASSDALSVRSDGTSSSFRGLSPTYGSVSSSGYYPARLVGNTEANTIDPNPNTGLWHTPTDPGIPPAGGYQRNTPSTPE